MIRLFIADDHPIVREGLRRIVAGRPRAEVVGEVGQRRRAARARFPGCRPTSCCSTCPCRDRGFLQVLERLARSTRRWRSWCSASIRKINTRCGPCAPGAAGYLTKDHSPEQLDRGHPQGLPGRPVRQRRAGRAAGLRPVATAAQTVRHEALSHREYEVLCLLGLGAHGQGDLRSICASAPRPSAPTAPGCWRRWTPPATPTSSATPRSTD